MPIFRPYIHILTPPSHPSRASQTTRLKLDDHLDQDDHSARLILSTSEVPFDKHAVLIPHNIKRYILTPLSLGFLLCDALSLTFFKLSLVQFLLALDGFRRLFVAIDLGKEGGDGVPF